MPAFSLWAMAYSVTIRIREGRFTVVWRLGFMPKRAISSKMPPVPP